MRWRMATRQRRNRDYSVLNEDCLEFANEYRASEVIEKYCSFMPVLIFTFPRQMQSLEYETIDEADLKEMM